MTSTAAVASPGMPKLIGRGPLRALARAEREISFGSYPFGHGSVGEMGTHLVVRGRIAAKVEGGERGHAQSGGACQACSSRTSP